MAKKIVTIRHHRVGRGSTQQLGRRRPNHEHEDHDADGCKEQSGFRPIGNRVGKHAWSDLCQRRQDGRSDRNHNQSEARRNPPAQRRPSRKDEEHRRQHGDDDEQCHAKQAAHLGVELVLVGEEQFEGEGFRRDAGRHLSLLDLPGRHRRQIGELVEHLGRLGPGREDDHEALPGNGAVRVCSCRQELPRETGLLGRGLSEAIEVELLHVRVGGRLGLTLLHRELSRDQEAEHRRLTTEVGVLFDGYVLERSGANRLFYQLDGAPAVEPDDVAPVCGDDHLHHGDGGLFAEAVRDLVDRIELRGVRSEGLVAVLFRGELPGQTSQRDRDDDDHSDDHPRGTADGGGQPVDETLHADTLLSGRQKPNCGRSRLPTVDDRSSACQRGAAHRSASSATASSRATPLLS